MPALGPTEDDVRDAVREAWTDAFGVQVTDEADFYELGGESLTAMQLASRLKQTLGIRPPVTLVLERPVLDDFTDALVELCQEAG